MTFAEFSDIVQPFGFTVHKMYSNWLSTNKPDTTKAYMASVTLEKSEFPTWIDGICISAEIIQDKIFCITVHPTINKNKENEFYFAGGGKIITDTDKITKDYIEECLNKILNNYRQLKLNTKMSEIDNDFI